MERLHLFYKTPKEGLLRTILYKKNYKFTDVINKQFDYGLIVVLNKNGFFSFL